MKPPVLYYVRHGETDWNAEQRLQGQCDIALNPAGRAQALRCAEILRGLLVRVGRAAADLDYVSSPLLRARTSMELMRAPLGLDPVGYRTDPRLAEISFGEWEGLTYANLKNGAPKQLAMREQDPWRFSPPGGESYEQLKLRIADWHASLVHDTVISSHLNIGRALMVHLGLAPLDAVLRTPIDQAVVYIFDASGMTRHA